MTGSSYYNIEKAAAWRSSGSTQTQGRVYNERLILSLVRMHAELSKVELTQLTSLAPQTITSIVNEAAANALLVRGKPRRGGLGQPSVPYAINPSGAFGLGLTLWAGGGEVVLANFVGGLVDKESISLGSFEPGAMVAAVVQAVETMLTRRPDIPGDRIAGLGIASPFHGSDWQDFLELSPELATRWARVDLRDELDTRFQFPVYLLPDGVVAAAGELLFGAGLGVADFLHLHLGQRIGAGLVLNYHLYAGRNRLAGVIGDFSVVDGSGSVGPVVSLNTAASLPSALVKGTMPDEDAIDVWARDAARALGSFVWRAICLLDLDSIVVNTSGTEGATKAVARALRRQLAQAAATRPSPLNIVEGRLGAEAHAIGAAALPLLVRYSTDTEVLLK